MAKAGRPTKKTEEVVRKLEEAFKIDATVPEACSYAGIGERTYYDWLSADPEFRSKMEASQNFVFMHAKRNWVNAIVNNKDVNASIDFLKRRQKGRYSERQELGGADGDAIRLVIERGVRKPEEDDDNE